MLVGSHAILLFVTLWRQQVACAAKGLSGTADYVPEDLDWIAATQEEDDEISEDESLDKIGGYYLESNLGRGAFANVFEGRHEKLCTERVAVKQVNHRLPPPQLRVTFCVFPRLPRAVPSNGGGCRERCCLQRRMVACTEVACSSDGTLMLMLGLGLGLGLGRGLGLGFAAWGEVRPYLCWLFLAERCSVLCSRLTDSHPCLRSFVFRAM